MHVFYMIFEPGPVKNPVCLQKQDFGAMGVVARCSSRKSHLCFMTEHYYIQYII